MTRLRYFPVSYDVAEKTVIVIGSGEQALQKLRLLVRTEARLRLIAAFPIPSLLAFCAEYQVIISPLDPCVCQIRDVALCFIATGELDEDQRYAALVRSLGVPVNVVDRPGLSNFAVPALVDRAPVAVAISTDGAMPVLAQRVRGLIESLLPEGFGRIASLAQNLRSAVKEALQPGEARRRFYAGLIDGPAGQAALAGDMAQAERLARAELTSPSARPQAGSVVLIGAGPGADDLMTLRAQRLLQNADVIVHDHIVPETVAALGRRDAERICVGKVKGNHTLQQDEINALLVRLAGEGKRVARLKAGDPGVYGRAGEEIAALHQAGIACEIVPGVTAAFAAAADALVSLTLRGVSSTVVLTTAHGADSVEPNGLEKLAREGLTLAVYMGRSVAGQVAQRLMAAGLAPDMPVIAVEQAGRTDRRVFYGSLRDLPDFGARTDLSGPLMILIGRALTSPSHAGTLHDQTGKEHHAP